MQARCGRHRRAGERVVGLRDLDALRPPVVPDVNITAARSCGCGSGHCVAAARSPNSARSQSASSTSTTCIVGLARRRRGTRSARVDRAEPDDRLRAVDVARAAPALRPSGRRARSTRRGPSAASHTATNAGELVSARCTAVPGVDAVAAQELGRARDDHGRTRRRSTTATLAVGPLEHQERRVGSAAHRVLPRPATGSPASGQVLMSVAGHRRESSSSAADSRRRSRRRRAGRGARGRPACSVHAGLRADRLAVDRERTGRRRPRRRRCPAARPTSRDVTALSCHVRVVSTVNSIVWPSPPICPPLPPLPARSSLRRKRIGADASTTSIGTAATPVGYEHADRPGLVARAPTPPA